MTLAPVPDSSGADSVGDHCGSGSCITTVIPAIFSAVQKPSATTHAHETARSFPGVAHGMNLEIRCTALLFVYAQGTAGASQAVILIDASPFCIQANTGQEKRNIRQEDAANLRGRKCAF